MNSVVAIYDSHESAEEAVRELQHAGVDMKSLSIVGKGTHTDEHVVGYYNAGDRMKYWGKAGAFWGGLWGLLFGSAMFAVPGIGPVLAAGPIVAWIVAGLESAVVVGGISAVGAGLFSIGIPKDSVLRYETALKTDKFLLVIHGTPEAVDQARRIIAGTRHASYHVHSETSESGPEVAPVTSTAISASTPPRNEERLDHIADEAAERGLRTEQEYDASHNIFSK